MVSQVCLRTMQFQSHISILVNKSQSIVWNYIQNKKNYKYELRKGSFKAFDNSLGKHKYYIQQNEYYIWILKRKHKNYYHINHQSIYIYIYIYERPYLKEHEVLPSGVLLEDSLAIKDMDFFFFFNSSFQDYSSISHQENYSLFTK